MTDPGGGPAALGDGGPAEDRQLDVQRPDRYDTVTFLSDLGTADESVGVVHSVLAQLAPGVRIVDLVHDLPPFDVRAGSIALARSVQYLSPGVVIAAVDPGAPRDGRAVAVEVAGGRAVLIGPDNGLLAAAVAMVGGAERVVVLDDRSRHLESAGPTFAARDVYAPVAAQLCTGVPLTDLGTVVEASTLRPGLLPVARHEEGGLVAEVLWVDRFGNAQLNVDADDIAPFGPRVDLEISDRHHPARPVATFEDLGVGEIGLIVDSYGLVVLAADRSSAAEELSIDVGDAVTLRGGDPELGGVTTPVVLGQRRGEERA